jgi:hypothetical protein
MVHHMVPPFVVGYLFGLNRHNSYLMPGVALTSPSLLLRLDLSTPTRRIYFDFVWHWLF